MDQKLRSGLPYFAVPVVVLLATLLRLALAPLTGSSIPFVTYFAGSLLIAWYCGLGPAALTVALSTLAGGHYILAVGTSEFLPSTRIAGAAMVGFAFSAMSVSILLDIQRRTLDRARAAERDQRRVNVELARVNRDLELFAYSASHDMHEPVRIISLSSERLERSLAANPGEEVGRCISYIRESAQRMEGVLGGLLEYSTAGTRESGSASLIDSGKLLDQVLDSLQRQISESHALVSRAQLPQVAIEEQHLAQLFQILIENSLRYGAKRIDVGIDQRDGLWVFSIADDGIGIDPQYSEQVFELFKRLDRTRNPEGAGLGLAIGRRVAERYNGSLWLAKSNVGAGSTFCFSLPAALSPALSQLR